MYCTLHVIEHAKRSWILLSYKMNSQSQWNQQIRWNEYLSTVPYPSCHFKFLITRFWRSCWCFSFSSTTSSWFACQKINKIEKMKCVFFYDIGIIRIINFHHAIQYFSLIFSLYYTLAHKRLINEQKKKWFIMAVFVCRYHSIDEKRVQYLALLSL